MNWTRSGLLVVCALALGFPMSVEAATQTIIGESATAANPSPARPVSIFIGDTGSLQAKRGAPFDGTVSGMFFPGGTSGPAAAFWHLRVKGAPAAGVTFGPRDAEVTTVSNGPVLGDWTAASPARVDTLMRVQHNGADLFEVRQSVLYVAAELRYRVVWDIRNVTGQAIAFIFGTSADLFIESDAGEGLFVDGPNRFVGGRNKFSGTVGGLEQVTSSRLPGEAAATPIAPWASYEEGDPFPVTRRLSNEDAFRNTINPLFMDNAVGVSFDDRATAGLAAGQTARYEVMWHLSRPTTASIPPRATDSREAVPPPPESTGTGGGSSAPAATAAATDTAAPILSALRLAPRASRSSASRGKSVRKIVFRLSEPAGVALRIVRRTAGRRVTVRTLTRSELRAGSNSVRIAGKRLAPGSYVVTARATDAAGNTGAQRSVAFRVSAG